MRFYIQTFGCQMNENDSLLIAGLLRSAGHSSCAEAEQADLIIVNTCCVRENAENRALGYIGSLKKLKTDRPERIIAVCGCMAQRQGVAALLSHSYRHVGIVIGTFAAARLPQYVAAYEANGMRIVDIEERYDGEELLREEDSTVFEPSWRAQVNISFGCNNFCSYCIVPYVRGRERSRDTAGILTEIKQLAHSGVREVQLLGQNVNSYGHDLGAGESFAGLLRQAAAVEGLLRVRYMTSHPRDFTDELIETIASLPKVCHHFHLPLQSGCDRLLKLMNRGYTTEKYAALLQKIRSFCPDAVITTDLIVGFPGETEADFEETLDFITNCEFDSAYTFLYSRRSGTPAAVMPDQVPEPIKHERIQRLNELQNPISLRKNEAMVGSNVLVMAEGPSKNKADFYSGRTDGNKIVVFPASAGLKPGDRIRIHIDNAQTWNMTGTLIRD